MVHYIRFLKAPRVTKSASNSFSVTALVTISTDLGDSLLLSDAILTCCLVEAEKPTHALAKDEIQWESGQRERCLRLQVDESIARGKSTLRVAVCHGATGNSISSIVGVWSAPFEARPDARASPIVERSICLPHLGPINIWEEAGTSLSAHIWDAAIGCLLLLQDVLSTGGPMRSLHRILRSCESYPINILELGAGCGVVGIAIATWFPNCSVQLTDQADAQDLLSKNLEHAKLAKGSFLTTRVVDWYAAGDADHLEHGLDLVVVSDCIYNADSCPALVNKLIQLSKSSPDLKMLIARKRRHESEEVFFQLMQDAEMFILEQTTILLADETPDATEEPPLVEFYMYGVLTGPRAHG